MSQFTPQEKQSIRDLIANSYPGLDNAALVVALTTRPVVSEDYSVPQAFTASDVLGAIGESIAGIPEAGIEAVRQQIDAQSISGVSNWMSIAALKGYITAETAQAVGAVLARTETRSRSVEQDSPLETAIGRRIDSFGVTELNEVKNVG